MRMSFVAVVLFASFRLGIGAEPQPQPPRPLEQPSQSGAAATKDQINHLKAAAEHLAKAGRQGDADRLREQAHAIESDQMDALVARKEKELDAIRAEIEQLRKLTRRQAITFSFDLIEIPLSETEPARAAAIENLFETVDRIKVIQPPATIDATIDTLVKTGLIKAIARPKMTALSGESLVVDTGVDVPVRRVGKNGEAIVENIHAGTRIDVQPTAMDNGKIRLAFHVRATDQDENCKGAAEGMNAPCFNIRDVQSAIEMELGCVYMLRGLKQRHVQPQPTAKLESDETDVSETILFVSAQRLESQKEVKALSNAAFYGPIPMKAATVVPNSIQSAR